MLSALDAEGAIKYVAASLGAHAFTQTHTANNF